jgi:uncharacterized membrane protein
MRKYSLLSLGLIVLAFVLSGFAYAHLPAIVATHWNAAGEVNGYMSKFWGVFFVPLLTLGLFLFLSVLPRLDPLHKNAEGFRAPFDRFLVLLVAFMTYIHALTLAWNLGVHFSLIRLMIPAFSVLFFGIGSLISRAKRNWFIGIRTPWTLSSDKVWNETHRVGGTWFKIAALISLLGVFFERAAFLFILIPILAVAIGTVMYSYAVYRKGEKARI